eukprot:CAMPEP_0115070264 /NCGR_PEP_ID=MMETSP0227-20121206/13016_1 /TAXON_ID=89957 /ORGANISM="Polarella glacialis, Strain CCMP 1383" /LENGTH=558 /DNA_ID=CAMNT_0002456757 /DNA_START=34 /DNA_END=1710 /DNA_ORIENTATION=+
MFGAFTVLVLTWASQAAAASPAETKPPCTDVDASMLQLQQSGLKMLPDAAIGPTQKYMMALVRDDQGKPNPRVTCTAGNFHARKTISAELAALGLQPLGVNGSFEWKVDGTSIPGCEQGIANLVGYVKGTEEPDEFLMWVAHYDGPNNQGPSGASQGNNATDDAYDDMSSIAVGLSLAAALSKDPPKLSVIFFFSDGEEGWDNVGVPPLGSDPTGLTKVAKELCSSGRVPYPPGTDPCKNYPIGFTAWAQKPTVELQKLRLLLDADPLGAPGVAGSDFVAVLGTESTPGLQALFEAHWPGFEGATRPIFANRNYAASNYDDVDALTGKYSCSGTHCLADAGVPFVWLAQTGFQKYHGGMMAPVTQLLEKFGKYVFADFASLTPYYALDQSSGTDPKVLDRTAATMLPLLRALADNTKDLQSLHFNKSVYEGTPRYTLRDAMNNKADVDYLIAALSKGSAITHIPEDATTAFLRLLRPMSWQLASTLMYYKSNPWYWNTDPDTIYPGKIFQTVAPLIFAVTIGIDFYSVADPNRQIYSVSTAPEGTLDSALKELRELKF